MSTLRPLLRIARRDAWRAKGRSTLIALMIALPVFALSTADVLARTAEPNTDERITRELGQTGYSLDAVTSPAAKLAQAPDPTNGRYTYGGQGEEDRTDLRSVVPAGATLLTLRETQTRIRTEAGETSVQFTEVAAGAPQLRGRYELRSGRAAAAPGEVLVTPEVLDRTGLGIGATLDLLDPDREVTVVGTAAQPGRGPSDENVFAYPGTLIDTPGGIPDSDVTSTLLFVADAPPLTWSGVEALNKQGIVAYDRDLVADPPPESEVAYYSDQDIADGRNQDLVLLIIAGGTVGGLAALEVILLAGAAFAVGARRQARSLALLTASGGSTRHVRLVVLSGGLVLGAVAAVVGVIGGIASAALARPLLTRYADQDFARFDLRPLELGAIALLGVATGVAAAVFPARTAARTDVVAALGGRRGQVATRKRVPVIGVVITATGVALAAGGSLWTAAQTSGVNAGISVSDSYLVAGAIAGGAGLAVIGLVILSPAVIGAVGRLGRVLPLAPRMAVRDAARHRGRSAPAMAAVLAAVSGSAALLLYVAAIDDSDRRDYQPMLPDLWASVELRASDQGARASQATGPVYRDAGTMAAVAGRELPVSETVTVRRTGTCYESSCAQVSVHVPAANNCPTFAPDATPPTEQEVARAQESDWRCAPQSQNGSGESLLNSGGYVVGDAAFLRDVLGVQDAAAARTLETGGVVTFDRHVVTGTTVTFDKFAPGAFDAGPPAGEEDTWTGPKPTSTVSLPVTYLDSPVASSGQLLSPAAAQQIGLPVLDTGVLFRLDRAPTGSEQDAAEAALRAAGAPDALYVERGYVSDYGLGLLALVIGAGVITLGAAGVATGLAQADARADHATLAAVGAAPRLRRTLAAFQALLISGLGTLLGVSVGFVPAIALIGAIDNLRVVLPWTQLIALLVAIPLIAAGSAWLCTRSRLPLERRMAA